MNPILKKTLLASSVAMALGAANAQAALVTDVLGPNNWSTDSANFTLLYSDGGGFGITNDVNMVWDGNAYNSSSDYIGLGSAANVTASSTTPFLGHNWTAHDIQMFLPGSYSFDVTLDGSWIPETGFLTATVGPGQLGMHMLFDWNANLSIDMFVVFAQSSIFGSGLLYSTQINNWENTCAAGYTGTVTKNCLYDGYNYGSAGAPVKNQIWMLASMDPDGDGVMGVPMATGGPFAGFSANINANLTATPDPIPIPAAVWLFGSGLLGLVGVARHRKKTA